MDYIGYYQSPLGEMLLACDDQGMTGLWFDGAKHYGRGLAQEIRHQPDHPYLQAAKAWLEAYFAGQCPSVKLPLSCRGTPFQQRVWHALQAIPYGQTVTYGQLAHDLSLLYGLKMSARAVGGAVGRNPLSIMVPCHRVLGADGRLTGYAGGLERKLALLTLEKSRLG